MATQRDGELVESNSADGGTSAVDVAGPGVGANLAMSLERFGLVLAWAIVIAFFAIMRPDTFFTGSNFSSIFASQAVLVVLTIALLIPLMTGDYDLSVAYHMNFAAMTLAVLNVNHHWPILLSIVFVLGLGAFIGLCNASIVLFFGIDPFVITLGSGTVLSGLTYWISGSQSISGLSPGLIEGVVIDRFLGIPLEFYYGVILVAIVWYVQRYTPLGQRMLVVGRNRSVARLSGYNIRRIRVGALVFAGLLSALAGILWAGTLGGVDPSSGSQLLLPAFAANFLGATALTPGRFNAFGSVIAVYFLVTGINGFSQLGAQAYVQPLFYGGALVLAVVLSQASRRKAAREAANQ